MRQISALIRRELIAYFSAPLAYIVMLAFLLMQGAIFSLIIAYMSQPGRTSLSIIETFFGGTVFFWFFLIVAPLITMRLIAEERRSGTLEVLMTSPVTEAQVIVAKFLGAWVFYLILWAPTLIYILLLASYAQVDWGAVAAAYLGVALLGVVYVALGVYTSTLTKNQVIAAIISFSGLLILLFGPALTRGLMTSSSALTSVADYVNMLDHMAAYSKGIVDTRHVLFELTLGGLFLFLATKSLELNKWR